jgi:hypothetical protein
LPLDKQINFVPTQRQTPTSDQAAPITTPTQFELKPRSTKFFQFPSLESLNQTNHDVDGADTMDINRSTVRNLTKQFLDSPNATNSQDDLNSLHVSAISTTYREKKQPKLNQDQIPGIKTATILRKSEPKPTMSNRISIFGPSSDYFSDCSYDLKRSLSDSSLYKHGIKFLHSRDNRLNERGGPIHDQKKQIKSEMRDSCIISGIGNGFDEQSSMFQKQKLNSSESTRNLFRSTSVISNKNEQFDCKRIF